MKRLAVLSTLLVALVGLFVVTAPGLVSIEVVRRSIAYEIAGWGGRALTFDGTPTVAFRPYLTVTFPKARITSSRSGDVLVSMDQLSAQIPLLPLIFRGRIEPSAFDFRKPAFEFRLDAQGHSNWTLPYGLDATTRVTRLSITNGSVRYRTADGQSVDLAQINAKLRWPEPAGPATIEGNASWRGQSGDFSATIGSLRDFFEGRETPLQFALASNVLRSAFTGKIQQEDQLTANGALSINIPSIFRLGQVLALDLADRKVYGAAALQGSLTLIRNVATLSDATLSLDGNNGEGLLALDLSSGRPAVQATLAFDDFEISPFTELAADVVGAMRAQPQQRIDLAALDQADLDVRVSADRLLQDGQVIGRIAGSAALRSGRLDVALADMRLFDGRVSASLTADTAGEEPSLSMRAHMEGMPLKSFPTGLFPMIAAKGIARGDLSLQTDGARWADIQSALSGTGSLSVKGGALTGIDLSALRAHVTDPAGAQAAIRAGSTDVDAASLDISIREGAVHIDHGLASGSGFKIELGEAEPLRRPAGDLRGAVDLLGRKGASARIPFTIDERDGLPDFSTKPDPARTDDHGSMMPLPSGTRTALRVPLEEF